MGHETVAGGDVGSGAFEDARSGSSPVGRATTNNTSRAARAEHRTAKQFAIGSAVYTLLNALFAAVFIVLTAPLMLFVALVILISDGRPILYIHERLGRDKRRYRMYKFRSLKRNADKIIGATWVTKSHSVAIRGGQALRDCRLDELPQLFNILKGDMNFFGPRPERPSFYEEECKDIPGYDDRFRVKPGLVGYSQVFTPHATPKRLRVRLDNRLTMSRQGSLLECLIVFRTGWAVLQSAAMRVVDLATCLVQQRLLKRYRPKRSAQRVILRRATSFPASMNGSAQGYQIVDMTEESLRIRSSSRIDEALLRDLRLQVEIPKAGGRLRTKTSHCAAELLQIRQVNGHYDHILRYKPKSEDSHYVVEQYFLKSSLANPF